MKAFNTIFYNINRRKFEYYNVIPYLVDCYKKEKDKPTTFDEFKKFIERKAQYQWWSRCEYEIILIDWPCKEVEEKWDIYDQVMMNIDIITNLVMESI